MCSRDRRKKEEIQKDTREWMKCMADIDNSSILTIDPKGRALTGRLYGGGVESKKLL